MKIDYSAEQLKQQRMMLDQLTRDSARGKSTNVSQQIIDMVFDNREGVTTSSQFNIFCSENGYDTAPSQDGLVWTVVKMETIPIDPGVSYTDFMASLDKKGRYKNARRK